MKLGKDFWLFRTGQGISVIGDAASNIAFAWWILDVTGSVSAMSSVVAPAMFTRVMLLPLLGPIGDRISRKKLIIISDLWRCVLTLALVALVMSRTFHLSLVILLYVLLSAGTALFNSVATSIIPQLVEPEQIGDAIQKSQAVMAVGTIVGGLVGGTVVGFFGIKGAFLFDALSFLVSGVFAAFINAKKPVFRKTGAGKGSFLKTWKDELAEGFALILKTPVLLWMSVLLMLINFIFSPINIALPVLVKEIWKQQPSFLGILEAGFGCGTIIGALIVGWLCAKLWADRVIFAGLLSASGGILLLSFVSPFTAPVILVALIGIGISLCDIPLLSRQTLIVPDSFRSRFSATQQFACQLMSPLGIYAAGWLMTAIGTKWTLFGFGTAMIALSPLTYRIPGYKRLYRLSDGEAERFLDGNIRG